MSALKSVAGRCATHRILKNFDKMGVIVKPTLEGYCRDRVVGFQEETRGTFDSNVKQVLVGRCAQQRAERALQLSRRHAGLLGKILRSNALR